MSEFEEKLNALLSNPDAMSQVMNLAQSLNLGGSGGAPEENAERQPPPPADSGGAAAGIPNLGNLAGLGSLFGQIDPNLIQKLIPLISELTSGDDERLQLLYALRPFLKPERRGKVEQAARTARLIHVGKKLLKDMGDPHV